jgi:hypothetical protein
MQSCKAVVIKHLLALSILDGKTVRQIFTYMDMTICFIEDILMNLTIFMGIPNSIRILYNTSLLTES